MSKRYIILAIVFIGIAAGLSVLPKKPEGGKTTPEKLHQKVYDPARYLSSDHIADLLINQDPSILLIDVRDEDEYEDYALPNSVNIPLGKLFSEDMIIYLDQPGTHPVFYSNGDVRADQAWILAKRAGFKHMYVMQGGLNHWFETIINPTPPEETSPIEDFEIYNFRVGARNFFTGGGQIETENENNPKPKPMLVRKKKKNVAEGGC